MHQSQHREGNIQIRNPLPPEVRWEKHLGVTSYAKLEEWIRRWPRKEDLDQLKAEGRELILLPCGPYQVSYYYRGYVSYSEFTNKFLVCSKPISPESDFNSIDNFKA